MAGTVPLILKAEPVRRLSLGPQKLRTPSVAVVYASADGELHMIDSGKPITWSDQLLPRFRMRYEVDLRDYVRTVELRSSPPVSATSVYSFDAVLNVGFRVTDPAEVVRRNIDDGLVVVYNHLVHVCRDITTQFSIERAKAAEDAINAWFSNGETLDEGITIYRCRARLSPDSDARRYLQAQEEARRSNVVKAVQHQTNLDDAARSNQLALMRQSGELQMRLREREEMAGRPLTARELITIHLERNPHDTVQAMALLTAAEEATHDRQDAAEARSRELFAFLVQHDLVKPVDIARFRDHAMAGLHSPAAQVTTAPTTTDWDTPLPELTASPATTSQVAVPADAARAGASAIPGLIPVYLVVDESIGESIQDLNEGLQSLYDALAARPDIASVVRLSVFGYAHEVHVELALAAVGGYTPRPQLTAGTSARFAAVFQQLLDCIPRDAETLKAQHPTVRRPQVLFLSGTRPADDAAWSTPYRQLVDRTQVRYAPDIIACGIGDASPAIIASIATRPEFAFVATDSDRGRAVARFSTFVRNHVLSYGRAILDGDPGPVFATPVGFQTASNITP